MAGRHRPLADFATRRALDQRQGFIWRRNLSHFISRSIVERQIATGIYAPLRWQDQSLGVICVDSPEITTVFNRDDLRLVMAVAQYAALAVSNCQMQEQFRAKDQFRVASLDPIPAPG